MLPKCERPRLRGGLQRDDGGRHGRAQANFVTRGCCQQQYADCAVFVLASLLDSCGTCAGGTTGRKADAEMNCLGLCPRDLAALAKKGIDIANVPCTL